MNRLIMVALFVWTGASVASATPPYRPYVDPTQLDCPWPKHSDYKQPWRSYLQTKSAVDFLAGIGVNWASPGYFVRSAYRQSFIPAGDTRGGCGGADGASGGLSEDDGGGVLLNANARPMGVKYDLSANPILRPGK